MRPGVRRLLVVLALAGAGLVPAPAEAAGYCSGTGVSVVVDYGALGGGIVKDCDASGNRNAARAFEDTGHHLSYASNQPGFVCRVDGVPTSDPCVNTSPANAYWGLYWSDGTSGWKYSSVAVGSLTVPAGATVAFSWQNGGGDPPGTDPAPPPAPAQPSTTASSPRPTRAPTTSRPTATTHASATTTSRPSTPSPTSSVSPSTTPTATDSPTASASADVQPPVSDSPSSTSSTVAASGSAQTGIDPAADSGGGLPWWVPVGTILVLAGAGGAVWRVRRARS